MLVARVRASLFQWSANWNEFRRDFPDVKILTNFGYKNQDFALNDWQQLIDFRSDAGCFCD